LVPECLSRAILKAYLPHLAGRFDQVLAPSPSAVRFLRTLGVTCPIEIVPNGVDLVSFREPRLSTTRAELGIGEQEKILISVGRLGPEKNLAFMLRALAGICQLLPDTSLVLLGEGKETENLRDQAHRSGIADRVRFVGEVAYDEVPGYTALADVFVVASKAESFGMAALEAMAAGLPVVGIAAPGIGEVVKHGVSGLLVPEEVDAFVRATADLLTHDGLRESMSQGALEVSETYAIAETSGRILSHYERLVGERASAGTSGPGANAGCGPARHRPA
jgi:glycosyltransferase involved in cell wall biosynthesis